MNELLQIVEAHSRFKNKGLAPGGQCAIALLTHITGNSKKIYVTPEPDQLKELQLASNDLFLLRDLYGMQDIQTPVDKSLKISRWTPILLEIMALNPSILCVAQLTSLWSTLASKYVLTTWAKKGDTHPNILRLSYWKLLEKITHDTSSKEFLIPIINYGTAEEVLSETREMLKLHPNSCSLIIRDYGMFVWGKSLADVQNRAEIIEHLCQLQIQDFVLFEKANLT